MRDGCFPGNTRKAAGMIWRLPVFANERDKMRLVNGFVCAAESFWKASAFIHGFSKLPVLYAASPRSIPKKIKTSSLSPAWRNFSIMLTVLTTGFFLLTKLN